MNFLSAHDLSQHAGAPQHATGRRAALGVLVGGTLATLGGCAGVDPSRYAQETPTLDLQRYFDGEVDAWGVFQDRSGVVRERFTVALKCAWQDNVGTLDERFLYADGRQERRVWTLRRSAQGHYTGTAADVIGEARGIASGNALNWRYTLALPVDGRTWHVDFDDWMFLVDNRVLLNRARMSKLGITLGEVLISFTRRGA